MRCVHEMRFGALPDEEGGARFALWAPAAQQVELLLHGPHSRVLSVPRDADGFSRVRVADVQAGQPYQWRIDGERVVPDPASRRNPAGPHGPSVLVAPDRFEWDGAWQGRPWHEAVFYQLHVGSFTAEGSFAAAEARLPELAALGITAVQLMPLGDFPGGFGWGYDGVLPFAPYHGYGTPQALKRLVQAAHRLGLMVLGDVVYNHFGPDGNHLAAYAPQFFSARHRSPWGAGLNFDGEGRAVVREFFIANALYWLQEFRFDGLRLDAVHAIVDECRPHFLEELSARVRAECAPRHVHLVLENDSNDAARLASPGTPGRYDGQWNGDVHHTLHVLLTGERAGYYAEYDAPIDQLARCLTHGFARQGGPHNAPAAAPRRAAEGRVPLSAVVNFLQNHDQIGNRARGERLQTLADPKALQLAAAIVGLAPSPPMLFMGEERGAETPFLYFADWQGELAEAVRRGRRAEFAAQPEASSAAPDAEAPDPCSRASFELCKLGAVPAQDLHAQGWHRFYRRLLAERAQQLTPWLPMLCAQGHASTRQGGLLALCWAFDADATHGSWCMQVNLSDAPVRLAPGPMLLATAFEVGELAADRLGPWAGRWWWAPRGGGAAG